MLINYYELVFLTQYETLFFPNSNQSRIHGLVAFCPVVLPFR